jgi:hypothetical protein
VPRGVPADQPVGLMDAVGPEGCAGARMPKRGGRAPLRTSMPNTPSAARPFANLLITTDRELLGAAGTQA